MNYNEVFQKAILQSNGNSNIAIENAIAALRQAGASQIKSVKILMEEMQFSLSQADERILHSETWRDKQKSTLNLREAFYQVISSYPNDHS